MKNQVFNRNMLVLLMFLVSLVGPFGEVLSQSTSVQEQVSLSQVQWKSEQQVRDLLGEPISVKGPVGTHASYTLWQYSDITLAFANKRVFHLFRNDSLKKLQLD